MLLRNYDNLMVAKCMPVSSTSKIISTDTDVFGDGHLNVLSSSNIKRAINFNTGWRYTPCSYFTDSFINTSGSLSEGMSGLVCGNGDTPVTYDDYALELPFTASQVGYVSGAHKTEMVYNESDNSWTTTYTRPLAAITDIVVKEIGVYTGFYYGSSYDKALVYRKVLDTPIEVTAGSNFILTFTTVMSANPNKPADYDASAAIVE